MIPKSKTILLTGGAGFIGMHLAKRLMDLNYKLIIVDNFDAYYDIRLKKARLADLARRGYRFKLYRVDIADYQSLVRIAQRYHLDGICHQAAQAGVRYSLSHPWVYERTNILGTLNLLEITRRFKIKDFIYASSSSVYGGNQKIPFLESDCTDQPISLYAATKKSVEALVYAYHHLYKFNCVGFRYFSVYGPWGRPDMALFKFVQAIDRGQPIEVYNFGQMKRNWTYVDDITNGVLAAMTKNFNYEIFNLGSGQSHTLNEFINLIEVYLGKKAQRILLPLQPGDIPATYVDITKAKKLLGWQPRIPLSQGIKRFIQWYQSYSNWLNKIRI